MTRKKRQQLENNLPQWTEEFVQREWYREFLQIYSLEEHYSLLEIYPYVNSIIKNYEIRHKLKEFKKNNKFNRFIDDLRWGFLGFYYNNIYVVIFKLYEKYGQVVYDDLNCLKLCEKWFKKNIEINVKLDKKYNLKKSKELTEEFLQKYPTN